MVKLVRSPAKVIADEKPEHCVGAPTERRWMTHKHAERMFEVLTVMQEGDNKAFDILMEIFEKRADAGFHKVATALDDMNIRGAQIVIAKQFTTTVDQLCEIALNPQHGKRAAMIEAINRNWNKAFMERAVPSGAHKWMHKKIATVPNATA